MIKTLNIQQAKDFSMQTQHNYFWTLGSATIVIIALQILSGVFLGFYYVPELNEAKKSIYFIITDINNGWLIYNWHVVGSSFVFIVVYSHILRGFYYRLYTWENRHVWWTGYIMFLILMATAFLGYILPWGQMSFWAATVILNMTAVIPVIGIWLTFYCWGGFTVTDDTLSRFADLHMFLPFLVLGLVSLHLNYIHTNKLTVVPLYSQATIMPHTDIYLSRIYPDILFKDSVACLILLIVVTGFICYSPEYFSNFINNAPVEEGVTPPHIIPEWYFLAFYGMLKLFVSKSLGVCCMVGCIVIPMFLPIIVK